MFNKKNASKLVGDERGFTLVELLVVMAIIAILASIALYSSSQYINKGRDATVKGSLVVLITAGELWYDRNDSAYTGFCNSEAVTKAFNEIPTGENDRFCNDSSDNAWAVCAKLFVDSDMAFCVDNRGNQKEIDVSFCTSGTNSCNP